MPEMVRRFADPGDPSTFERSKLDHAERKSNAHIFALHRDLLHLRRDDPVFSSQKQHGLDGAVLSHDALVIRFFGEEQGDRLLLVNLGVDLHLDPAPEPLLAPPESSVWTTLWSSEDPKYGGDGTPPLDTAENWRIPGHAAVVLKPELADG